MKMFDQWKDARLFIKILPLRTDMCTICSRFQVLLGRQLSSCSNNSAARTDAAVKTFSNAQAKGKHIARAYEVCQINVENHFKTAGSQRERSSKPA